MASDVKIYNKNMELVAFLQNAFDVQYVLELNALWTASFSLPADDSKNTFCDQFNYAEIYDGETRVDLFRIVGEELKRTDAATKTYECEHVLATLMDDLLFQYHQIGGVGVPTINVLNYILAAQDSTKWQLNSCAYTRYFEYAFENENLLSALFAVPNGFDSDYKWSWDTTVFPWQLTLSEIGSTATSEIRYGKNMVSPERKINSMGLANRIYPLGYGEGVNQQTIKDANNGVEYIEDTASRDEYGLHKARFVDRRFQSAETLKAYAEQVLAITKTPYISYEIKALDLYRLEEDNTSKFLPGEIVQSISPLDSIDVSARIVRVEKQGVDENPGSIRITIANKNQDIASSISDLQQRARINELYSQGATNLLYINFSDNADPTHPSNFRIYIPTDMVRINKLLLNLSFEPFRAFSQATAGGGSTTTSSGGATTSSSGGGDAYTSGTATNVTWGTRYTDVPPFDADDTDHFHGIDVVTSHGHVTNIDDHTHTVGNHTHTVGNHTHNLDFGIYEDTQASTATVTVDGNVMPTITDYGNIDIIAYLSKDGSGKITRGTWHTIEILPNTRTRINVALFGKDFTNSQGGGDF